MNSFLVLTVLCAAITVYGLSPELEGTVKVTFKKCMSSTGISPEVAHKLRYGQFGDPNVDKFAFCLFKEIDMMNDAGEFQVDAMITLLTKEMGAANANTVMETCNDITGKDKHDKALNGYKCFWNAASKHLDLTK